MSVAICRLTLRAHWMFPLMLGNAITTVGEAQTLIQRINEYIPDGDTLTLLYFLSGTDTVSAPDSTSAQGVVYFPDFFSVLKELLTGSISRCAKKFAFDQYRLDSFLTGHTYYDKVSGSRVEVTEADLRKVLLTSKHKFETRFQELLNNANKLAEIVVMPVSADSVSGLFHQVYLKAYDAECNAAARHAVALGEHRGVHRRHT